MELDMETRVTALERFVLMALDTLATRLGDSGGAVGADMVTIMQAVMTRTPPEDATEALISARVLALAENLAR